MPQINGRLSPEQLDSLEEWARVLVDEGEDESGNELLALLKERVELGELILRDEAGDLKVLVATQLQLEQTRRDNDSYRFEMKKAREHAKKYRLENIELKRQLEGHGALLKKVETLLNIARTRIEGGEMPDQVAQVVDKMFDKLAKKPQEVLEKQGNTGT